jgi:hypothetical protein
VISGGSLTVSTTFEANGGISLSGGALRNTTVTTTVGAQLIATGGVMDGVTLACDMNVLGPDYVHIVNGLTLSQSTVSLGNATERTSGQMYFDNTGTLDGTGTVLFGKSWGNRINAEYGAIVTVGSGITVRGSSGTLGYGSGAIVNQGAIAADDSGGLIGNYVYDTGYSGGYDWTGSTSFPVDTAGVSAPAPRAVYQTWRSGGDAWNPLTYTLGNLSAGVNYTVRLHFAESSENNVELRQFNVGINGTQVLMNYDIATAAGGMDKAVLEEFTATADGNGRIMIDFWQGDADWPLINGIELVSGATVVQAINCGLIPGGMITINPGTFVNQGTITVSDGEFLSLAGLTGKQPGAVILSGAGSSLTLDGNNYIVDQDLNAPAGTTLTLNGTWRNDSIITVAGATLNLGSSGNAWLNAGIINVADATVNLGGTLTAATLGNFQRTGGAVNLTGLLDNSGRTLALDATTGSWTLVGEGTISKGTVTATAGAQLIATGGTLDGVTLACDLYLDGNYYVQILNGLTLSKATVYLGDAAGSISGQMHFFDNATLGGIGTVMYGKNAENGIYAYGENGAKLTIGAGITIRGSSGTLGNESDSGCIVINQGTIDADDGGGMSGNFLYDKDYSGGYSSAGSTSHRIDISGVSAPAPQSVYQTWRFGGDWNPFTYALKNLMPGVNYSVRLHFADSAMNAVGKRQFNVSINGIQVLKNFDIVAESGGVDKAVMKSFMATADGNGQIKIDFIKGAADSPLVNGIEVLSGTTVVQAINCGMMAGGTIYINATTFSNQGTLKVSNGGALNVGDFTGNVGLATLTGAGSSLTLDGNYIINKDLTAPAGTTLTLNGTWRNTSTITAANATLNLGNEGNSWINESKIVVANSTVNLGGPLTVAGLGTIQNSGGIVNITGHLDNSGRTLALDATTGPWTLVDGGTISKGTVTATDGARLVATGGTLDGVTLACDLHLVDYNYVHIVNGLTLNEATIFLGDVAGTLGYLYFDNTALLGGTGTVLLGKNSGNGILANGEDIVLTIGSGITVRGGSGTLGNGLRDSIVNQGTISADGSGGFYGNFDYDRDFTEGVSWTASTSRLIDTSGVNNPAPQGVYQTERYGGYSWYPLSYTLKNLKSGTSYTVRLHFAESYCSNLGQRQFNVSINGTQVLLNYDIIAAAGGTGKAVVEAFKATAGANGQIIIDFWQGNAEWPLINGIELLSGSSVVQAINCGLLAGGTIAINASTFINHGTLRVSNDEALNIASPSGDLGNASINGVGSSMTLSGSVNIGKNDVFSSQAGATLSVTGNLLSSAHLPAQYSPEGTTKLNGNATTDSPQWLEAMSADLGNTPKAFVDNFGYGILDIGNNTYVKMTDRVRNAPGTGVEAVYVNSLIIEPGSTLDLNGIKLYARSAQLGGTVVGGSIIQTPDSGAIALATATPGAILKEGELDEWTFFGRGGQSVTVVVNPGIGSSPAPTTPTLDWVQVQLLDSTGTVLGTAASSNPGEIAALTVISLPADGNYRVQVRAAPQNSASTGNYLITVWNISASMAQIQLGQQVNGHINTPYSVQRWTFSAAAGQQIRFDLLNSDAGAVFNLDGPLGWSGFADLADNSSLITLPKSGAYTLTAHGTRGQYGQSFSFILQQTVQTSLSVNTTYNGTLAGDGDAQLFQLEVAKESPVLIQLANAGVDNKNEIYAKLGSPPTRGDYDFKFSNPASPNQQILIPNATAGTWYVLVYGDFVPTPGEYTLSTSASDVFIFSSSPTIGGTIGNTVLNIKGAGFNPNVSVQLVGTDDKSYECSKFSVLSGEQLTAEYLAGSVPAGTYKVTVTSSSKFIAESPDSFKIVVGGLPNLTTKVIVPSVIGYHMPSTLYIEYANTGTAVMPAPLLSLTATQNGLEGALLTLDQSRANEGLWTQTMPIGYKTSVTILASGNSVGWLQAGESNSVAVHYAGWLGSQWDFSKPPIYWNLGVLTTDETQPVVWNSHFSAPPGMPPADWEMINSKLKSILGSTWGQFVQTVNNYAIEYFLQTGQKIIDGDVLQQEVFLAAGDASWPQESAKLKLSSLRNQQPSGYMPPDPYEGGTVLRFDPAASSGQQWVVTDSDPSHTNVDPSRIMTIVIIHGVNNQIAGNPESTKWVTEMAENIYRVKVDTVNILAVDWGMFSHPSGRQSTIPWDVTSAHSYIPQVAGVATHRLFGDRDKGGLGLNPEKTHIIGHSAGCHIAQLIGIYSFYPLGTIPYGKVSKITLLEPSPDNVQCSITTQLETMYYHKSASYIDSYKSSRWFSGYTDWGFDNFILSDKSILKGSPFGNNPALPLPWGGAQFDDQLKRHEDSHKWYIDTIANGSANGLGFWWDSKSWNKTINHSLYSGRNSKSVVGGWKGIIDTTTQTIEALSDMTGKDPTTGTVYGDDYNKWYYPGSWIGSHSFNEESQVQDLLEDMWKTVELSVIANSVMVPREWSTDQKQDISFTIKNNTTATIIPAHISSHTGSAAIRALTSVPYAIWLKRLTKSDNGELSDSAYLVKRDFVDISYNKAISGVYVQQSLKLPSQSILDQYLDDEDQALLVIEIMPKSENCPLLELYPGNNLYPVEIHVKGNSIDANAGNPQRILADPDQVVANVILDGSGSGPIDQIVTYLWNENGISLSEGFAIAPVSLSIGVHEITLTIVDRHGKTFSDKTQVKVEPRFVRTPYKIVNNVQDYAVTSYDPNDKIGPSGSGTSGYIAANSLLPYRIDFENSSKATAPAQQVTVTDQLSNNLDWNTFQLTEIGFGDIVLTVPPGSQYYSDTVPMTYNGVSFEVQVYVDLDFASGIITADFYSIDPNTDLPPNILIGFLPPEDGTGRGQGHISYTIQPISGLQTGTQIQNIANIYFDQGEVITTDQIDPEDPSKGKDPNKRCLNTIDAGPPSSQVLAFPKLINQSSIVVEWAGVDDQNGSGVGSYDIYVTTDGGPWTLWQDRTTNTVAVFTGSISHIYGFTSVATDKVGNRETPRSSADVQVSLANTGAALIAGNNRAGTVEDSPVNLSVAKLLATAKRPTGLSLKISSVTSASTNGGSVVLTGNVITYTPAPKFVGQDLFAYTLDDGIDTAQGIVTVTVTPANEQSLTIISITKTANSVQLQFAGIPGRKYVVQSAASVTGPWADLSGVLIADQTGLIQFDAPSSGPTQFFSIRSIAQNP